MVGPRGSAFVLLCLPLICQVEAQAKVFLVNSAGGVGSSDGVYSEEGKEDNHRYQRMGGADEHGWYFYLYQGTKLGGGHRNIL